MPAPFSKAGSARRSSSTTARRSAAAGLCSYPHPWLMPEFWQVPTGSMGIGPISAIYQARFLRYLDTSRPRRNRRAACLGRVRRRRDGRARIASAGLTLAAREKLDNLTFIINCNLQRLDGPVRGNGQIIQELEALFRGAGWNVDQGAVGLGLGPAVRARQDPRAAAPLRAPPSTASIRRSAPRTAPTTSRISSTRIPSCARWSRT